MCGRCRNRREACNDLSPRARVVQLTPPRCHGSLRIARRGSESREMSARRCCAASVLRAMRCQRAMKMRANTSAGTRRCMCMRHSLKHRAQHLAPIERANRATVYLLSIRQRRRSFVADRCGLRSNGNRRDLLSDRNSPDRNSRSRPARRTATGTIPYDSGLTGSAPWPFDGGPPRVFAVLDRPPTQAGGRRDKARARAWPRSIEVLRGDRFVGRLRPYKVRARKDSNARSGVGASANPCARMFSGSPTHACLRSSYTENVGAGNPGSANAPTGIAILSSQPSIW